jgi:hypothetical protein
MATTTLTIVPTLEVATRARIRYLAWLQSIYNISQLQ